MNQNQPNSLLDLLTSHAAQQPDRIALICRDQTLSYGELIHAIKQCLGCLRKLRIGKGERVVMVMRDCPDWLIAFLGIIGSGAIAVPCSTMLRPDELAYVFNDCEATAAIITPDQIETVQSALASSPGMKTVLLADQPPDSTGSFRSFQEALAQSEPISVDELEPDAFAFILYTSGSTGSPKGAVHRHRDIPFTVEQYAKNTLGLSSEDRIFSSSRLFFAYGLGNSLSFPLGLGATSVLCRERPIPSVIAEIFTQSQPTIFFGVPATYRALLEYRRQGEELQTDHLQLCISAGESLPAQLFHEWKSATGLEIYDGIGSTEMLHIFISNQRGQLRPGSSGVPVTGYEVRLLDQEEHVIDGAGSGNLFVKGESAMTHYWNKPEKTAEAMRDGWVKTGDVYRRDADGCYWFEGRSDDMFKSSGMWVSPVEVEEALCALPEVLETAVVVERDADGTNSVAAFIVAKAGIFQTDETIARIKAQISQSLPRYKCPKQIYFIDQLPRTATGKVQRFKLRK